MTAFLAVFTGGGLGALLRYVAVHVTGLTAVWTIMLVNVAGSFLMGLALAAIQRGWAPLDNSQVQLFLLTGLLGGFTTFSAFSGDTLKMIEAGHIGQACLYVGGSVALSLLAVAAGYYMIGKQT